MNHDQTQFEERLRIACSRAFGEVLRLGAVARLSGGASQETWLFDVVTADCIHDLVLRRSASGFPEGIGAAVSMEMEAQVIRSAGAAGVAVPEIVYVLRQDDQLGHGFVSRFIPGESLGGRICRDPRLASARAVFLEQSASYLAMIHSVDPLPLEGLPLATPKSELERVSAAYGELQQPRPVFAIAIAWLRKHMIEPPKRRVLVHGDYRNGNMIVGPEGVRAVLDWEAAHLGDPVEDIAWFCAPSWRFGHLSRPAGGIGSKEELLVTYESASGHCVEEQRLQFWSVFSILRWGLMCASAEAAFTSGTDPSPQRAVIARRSSEAELDLLRALLPRGRPPPLDDSAAGAPSPY